PEPTAEFAAQVAEECRRLLDRLGDAELRSVALWKMEGYTVEEIAARLGCVPRTVHRRLRLIQDLWQHEIASVSVSPRADNEALERARRADEVCLRFEAAWREGGQPRIEDFLAAAPEPERPGLLRELVGLEIDYRRLRGENPRPEDYRDRFPALDVG